MNPFALALSILLLSIAPDLQELAAQEEGTESLSHALGEMSAACRGGEASALEPWFAENLESFASVRPGGGLPERVHPAITLLAWRPAAARPATRSKALAGLQAILDRFSRLEDVRFTLGASTSGPDGSRAAAFDCSFVGRDGEGRRLWLTGAGDLVARRDAEERWRLTSLVFAGAVSRSAERELFSECSEAAGLARQGVPLKARTELLRSYGAAAADVDGDGDVDLFTTAEDRGRLHLNDGKGRFAESARAARLDVLPRPALQPLFLDVDGDGDLDLFLTAIGPQLLFENRLVPDGALRFRDVSARAGVEVVAFGHSACAGDVNGDGRPDIHVASYGDYPEVVPDSWDGASNGTPNLLFLNVGDGRFREAAAELGVADARWSYAAALVDFDDDGDLDLTVANDFGGAVGLFLNRGEVEDGPRFIDVASERGLGRAAYGMGLSYGDPDRDGDLDLHVTKMSAVEGNRILDRFGGGLTEALPILRALAHGNDLYENLGDGRFREITRRAGGFRAGWAWGGGFLDVDNDGLEDLYSPNGFLSGELPMDTRSLFWREVVASKTGREGGAEAFLAKQGALLARGYSFSGHERDLLELNRGDGRFIDVSGASGIDSAGDGRAAVFADFDDDGDTDVFLRAMHGEAQLLFRNELGAASGHWLRLALKGRRSGTDAFGAVVRVASSGSVEAKVVDGGSGFLAQSDRRLLFGLGAAERADRIEVAWPSGLRQRFEGLGAGESRLIVEGEDELHRVTESPARLGGAGPGATAGNGLPALPGLVPGDPLPELGLEPGEAARLIGRPDGRPLLVAFFATWCGTCRRELPELQRLARAQELRLVGVSVDEAGAAARVPAFLAELGLTYPFAIAEAESARSLFAERLSLPVVLLLDGRERRVLEAVGGASRGALTELVRRAGGER